MIPYKIGIQRLRTKVSIGIYNFEKKKKQDLYISAELSFTDSKIDQDAMENSVDYDLLCDAIKKIASERHYELIENLAMHTAQGLKIIARAAHVTVRIDKPLAAKKNQAETIWVSVEA